MTARAAQCKCGVHGFAMNLLQVVTGRSRALLREARVTLPRRQTACRMRHCCARRIVGCRGRRGLGCTAARLAERQRIIEAEANRLAEPMAASEAMPPRRYFHSPGAALLRAASRQWSPFLLGGVRGAVLFPRKENSPPCPCSAYGAAVPRLRGEKFTSSCG